MYKISLVVAEIKAKWEKLDEKHKQVLVAGAIFMAAVVVGTVIAV